MNKYSVTIEETLKRTVEIEGDMTEEEALKIVRKKYENEEIVLDSNDFAEYNIYTIVKNK